MLIVSLASTLLLPKFLGVDDYSFWQLYVFYVGYVGILQFGWNDGIYLRHGGRTFEQLDRNRFAVQFWMLATSQILISCIVVWCAWALVVDGDRLFILTMTGLSVVIIGTRAFFLLVWQATNLIGQFAKAIAVEMIVFIAAVSVWFLSGNTGYHGLIFCDLVAKSVSLVMSAYWSRDLVLKRLHPSRADLTEARLNLTAGFQLMLANVASMLLVGVVRFAIERHWDVVTFGKVSLSLSIGGIVMVFVNAVGVVVFPTLRRIDPERKPELFLTLRTLYLPAATLLLFLYFPLLVGLSLWLPDYADSLRYLGLLFPVFIFEARMALLVNSYLKDLREERAMLFVNLGGVLLATLLAVASTTWLNNLGLAVTSIIVIVALRATVAEIVLWQRLKVRALADMLAEVGLTVVFICASWFLEMGAALATYTVCYLGYVAIFWARLRRATRVAAALVR